MTRNEFLDALADMLERPSNSFSGDDTLESLDWDSIRVIEFISVADEKLQAEVRPDAIAECITVNDLVALVTDKLT